MRQSDLVGSLDSTPHTTPQNAAAHLALAWRNGLQPDLDEFLVFWPDLSVDELDAVVAVDQQQRWQRGERVLVEQYLGRFQPLASVTFAIALIRRERQLRQQNGEEAALAEYLDRFPDLADALQFQEGGGFGDSSSAPSYLRRTFPGTPPPPDVPVVPGYEVLGILGKGGMGIVYRARQQGLGRLVALKMIRGDAAGEGLLRFQAEYRVLARLNHPNIVTIHDVGEVAGRPYFAMELLEVSLDHLLGHRPQAPRAAARLLATLARAIHAAHEKGIIHRDLKPSNILLGQAGTQAADGSLLSNFVPRLSDFGLARDLEEADQLTRTGAVLGTPCYLAPEQAEGKPGTIGPATDIYALGAILYELLTGRPPLMGENLLDTLEQVRHLDPIPPRRLVPGIPRDLEVVCLKCLRKDSLRRYTSADDLACDLDRFLDGKPVTARSTPPHERALKWARRRPALAAMAVALMLSVAGLVTLGILSYLRIQSTLAEVRQSNEELREARLRERKQATLAREAASREQDQRQLAERKTTQARQHLTTALRAVDQFCTSITEDRLLAMPHLVGLRNSLLDQGITFYDRLSRESSDDPAVINAAAIARCRKANLLHETGKHVEAVAAYHQAIAAFQKLGTPAAKRSLARTRIDLANVLCRLDRSEEALREYREGMKLFGQLKVPDDGQACYEQANSWFNLSGTFFKLRRMRETEEAMANALVAVRAWRKKQPDSTAALALEAKVLTHWFHVLSLADRLEQAKEQATKARTLYQELDRRPDLSLSHRRNRGRFEMIHARLCLLDNRPAQAVKDTEKGIAILEKLHRDHPQQLDLVWDLGLAYHECTLSYLFLGKNADAEEKAAKGVAHLTHLTRAVNSAQYLADLGKCLSLLAMCQSRQQKYKQAVDSYGGAIAVMEKGKKLYPHNPAWGHLPLTLAIRASILIKARRPDDILPNMDRLTELNDREIDPFLRLHYCMALVTAGRIDDALLHASRLAAARDIAPGDIYNAACVYARCLSAVRNNPRIPLARRESLRPELQRRALALLARAEKAGFFRADKERHLLTEDDDLKPLRHLDAFRRLRERVTGELSEN